MTEPDEFTILTDTEGNVCHLVHEVRRVRDGQVTGWAATRQGAEVIRQAQAWQGTATHPVSATTRLGDPRPRMFHEVLSDGYRAFQARVADREDRLARTAHVRSQHLTCDSTDTCLREAVAIVYEVPCCDHHAPRDSWAV